MPIIPALERLRWKGRKYEIAWATQQDPIFKKKREKESMDFRHTFCDLETN